ncbi:hypothetical protein AVEN_222960-1 [Araneus ventricosus]|uniref:Uncharacterized protein n=1 Tax=Araneus ventricosus TaxID=182803 RepID=A0A4Y2QSX1_ARAVE|nr:hypothetical protein AVEN_243502-1 [Araneus ventricosus]GBN66423.1 hypothetical protein AVEN_19934-1 [Araneus ventricosus]GBN66451.1 hypothetical protein AVEN_86123-1 [Araneus ventricosus]GBN66498.1 hypothetical protein AVEN_222960-1 [Araneus ventricosus]
MARWRQCIRSLERCGDICQVTRRRNGASVRIPPTTVHKCEPRATRSLSKPHAIGTRLQCGERIIVPPDLAEHFRETQGLRVRSNGLAREKIHHTFPNSSSRDVNSNIIYSTPPY